MLYSLSKSEFKLATDCYTRLKFKKNGYPQASDTDEFLEMLAEGGYMVGKLATLLYPDGIDINTDNTFSSDRYENTSKWMQKENVVLYEAAFKTADGRNIRADIIEKKGNQINLIEVKAKSWNSEFYIFDKKPKGSNKENVSKNFEPYLEDVTFQYTVVKELFADSSITPFLFLPDKATSTSIEGLNGLFSIQKTETTKSGFRSYDVQFIGDEKQLLQDKIMVLVDVSEFVNKNYDIILNRAKEMLAYMNADFDETLGNKALDGKCKSCDYRLSKDDAEKNGYKDCWGDLAYQPNHLFELYQFGNIFKGDEKKAELLSLIKQKKVTIQDIPDEMFKAKSGEYSYSSRPYYQKTSDKEIIGPELKGAIEPLNFPLYFIDFECSRMALPYHVNMRPYEIVAYQWSCHIIENKNAVPKHKEWINTEDEFPNFKFVASLYNLLKDAGTILIWSHYEKTVLKDILAQYLHYRNNGLGGVELVTEEIVAWLQQWQEIESDENSWVCDMEKLSRKYYFHPFTKGKSSIKPTLPAILNENKDQTIIGWLTKFGDNLNLYHIENGIIEDPYYSLPKIDFDDLGQQQNEDQDEDVVMYGGDPDDYIVRNGGAAMRAYQDMMYGFAKADVSKKEKIKNSLLLYCKLDTLAMVIIWKYWKSKF